MRDGELSADGRDQTPIGRDLLSAPGVDALVEALHHPGPEFRPGAAAVRVVEELRDLAGLSFDEVAEELEAFLTTLHPAAQSRLDRLSMGLLIGSAFYDDGGATSVSDPVTGLPDRRYLLHRAREARAHAEWLGLSTGAAWGLVVVRSPIAPDLFEWLVQRHSLAETMRECFRAGETVATVSSDVVVALVSSLGLDEARDLVISMLEQTGYAADVWVEPLPADEHSLRILLDELAHCPG